jgi:translation elongation factor EF-Tu-like GTPase
VGFDNDRKSKVLDRAMFRKRLVEARAGDNVAILLEGIERSGDIKRGQVLAEPYSIKAHSEIVANLRMYESDLDKWQVEYLVKQHMTDFCIKDGDTVQLKAHNITVTSTIKFDDPNTVLANIGDFAPRVRLSLTKPLAVRTGDKFVIDGLGREPIRSNTCVQYESGLQALVRIQIDTASGEVIETL